MKKRIIISVIIGVMLLMLCACGETESGTTSDLKKETTKEDTQIIEGFLRLKSGAIEGTNVWQDILCDPRTGAMCMYLSQNKVTGYFLYIDNPDGTHRLYNPKDNKQGEDVEIFVMIKSEEIRGTDVWQDIFYDPVTGVMYTYLSQNKVTGVVSYVDNLDGTHRVYNPSENNEE